MILPSDPKFSARVNRSKQSINEDGGLPPRVTEPKSREKSQIGSIVVETPLEKNKYDLGTKIINKHV